MRIKISILKNPGLTWCERPEVFILIALRHLQIIIRLTPEFSSPERFPLHLPDQLGNAGPDVAGRRKILPVTGRELHYVITSEPWEGLRRAERKVGECHSQPGPTRDCVDTISCAQSAQPHSVSSLRSSAMH